MTKKNSPAMFVSIIIIEKTFYLYLIWKTYR